MKLTEFPQAIANAEQAVNELNAQLAGLDQSLTRMELQAETVTVFDATLKNESQRKVRKHELLLSNSDYQAALDRQIALSIQKASATTFLNLLRNQFSVAKLEEKRAIAQMEVQAFAR